MTAADRVLDFAKRHGPWALLALFLVWDQRTERRELLTRLVDAQNANTAELARLHDAVDQLASAQRSATLARSGTP